MSGDFHSESWRRQTSRNDGASGDGPRSLEAGTQLLSPKSPLKVFGEAKKKINDIFTEINSYIDDVKLFVGSIVHLDYELTSSKDEEFVEDLSKRVCGIQEMLNRDRMKVAFFGRTSNGKSTVINAMLKRRILPTGMGHTTNCFLQVEGGTSDEGTMYEPIPGTKEEQVRSIESINQLASALSEVKLNESSLLRIVWPQDKCNLLRDDVVLVDSPGIDVSPDLDEWITTHCLDADVFVLVANAESTLMQTEKNFFHKVAKLLSKPNIFILQNRWDASARGTPSEETVKLVKQQHLDRAKTFLVNELGVVSKAEAEKRIFFVSAEEALIARVHQEAGTPTPTSALSEGHQGRLFEFATFERRFEECISQSAVQTKFAQHAVNGKEMVIQLHKLIGTVRESTVNCYESKQQQRIDLASQLDYVEKQLELLTSDVRSKIDEVVMDIEKKVASAFTDEIRRLSSLVDQFNRPFHPDNEILLVYKQELHKHVEDGLGHNLAKKLSDEIIRNLTHLQSEITDRLTALLSDERRETAKKFTPSSKDFGIMYRLDCRNLCRDFQEDIEFRFSLGLTSLFNRYLSKKFQRAPLLPPTTPMTPSNERRLELNEGVAIVQALTHFTTLYSSTTIGILATAGFTAKALGWRVMAVAASIYGGLYIYERLTWTRKAREKAFKRQYVDYASNKLRLIVDLTSSNCSHQVATELNGTYSRLASHVTAAQQDMKHQLVALDEQVKDLEAIGNKAKKMKHEAEFLDTSLTKFMKHYLGQDYLDSQL